MRVQAYPSACVMLQSLFLQSRRIVVRELNGILREATWEERDRMCQVETCHSRLSQYHALGLVLRLHNDIQWYEVI